MILIDKILVLSRKKDTERRKYAEKQLHSVNIKDFEWFDAIDGYQTSDQIFINENIYNTDRGSMGCSLSHKRIFKYIIDNKLENVMVFEDDIIFHENFNILYNNFIEKTPTDYGIIFMGYCSLHLKSEENVIVNYFPYCTHSYIINNRMAKWFLENWKLCDTNIDVFLKKIYTEEKCPYKSYAWWNGGAKSIKQKLTRLGVYFSGIVFQNHDINHSMVNEENQKDVNLRIYKSKLIDNIDQLTSQYIKKIKYITDEIKNEINNLRIES